MWHGYAVTSSTLLADPPSNETIDVLSIKEKKYGLNLDEDGGDKL